MTGWAVNAPDEQAIALLPAKVWTAALRPDGKVHEIKGPDGDMVSYQVAQLTCLRELTGRPAGLRLIVRRLKLSRRDAMKLTAFEKRTAWHYQILAHERPRSPRAFRRSRLQAGVVRGRLLPWSRRGRGLRESDETGQPRAAALEVLAAWLPAATIAADLDACTRLLLLDDEPELVAVEPRTIRMKLYHLPARLTARARGMTPERSAPHPTRARGARRHRSITGRPRSARAGDTDRSRRCCPA
ncbi:hypothetical protein P9869_43500 [Streptomyces ossamyceticus]|nr:hypothetical protein [Streptomyces ossamyceticus]